MSSSKKRSKSTTAATTTTKREWGAWPSCLYFHAFVCVRLILTQQSQSLSAASLLPFSHFLSLPVSSSDGENRSLGPFFFSRSSFRCLLFVSKKRKIKENRRRAINSIPNIVYSIIIRDGALNDSELSVDDQNNNNTTIQCFHNLS